MMEYKNVMLISPDTIKAFGDLNYNVEDGVIGASIRAVQNVYLTDIIGVDLVEKLQQLIYNRIKGLENNIDDASNYQYKALLDDYINDVMAYKVAAEMCVRMALKMRNAGIIQTNDTNITNVSLKDVKYLSKSYDTYFNAAVNRMVKFIKENKSAFPELDNVCCSKFLSKYGNTGLWLG